MMPKSQLPSAAKDLLALIGEPGTLKQYRRKQVVFAQGASADTIFYLQKGRVKLSVVSKEGKEAVVALLSPGNFFGEGCLAGQAVRIATATAAADCSVLRLPKTAALRAIHNNPAFAELFVTHLLTRNIRIEEDLVDQLFNSSEKRLARLLLLLANFRQRGQARTNHSEDQPGNPGGNDRHHALAGKLLYEQVSAAGLYQVRRGPGSSQFSAQCRPARLR
jgi:CRP-like cAMP-binding protein